ncbi:MAG TPA: DUF1934 domain-containing protein [Aliicoccus persicus]|uniref:DUF1934 domain-containing protein n=1 Tax=Aliicoccus persicus TaxID=930138 RepID=A0A921DWA7_9STAP|nr:DUF1934 domain-containing protein [Aliicoccus persicus]
METQYRLSQTVRGQGPVKTFEADVMVEVIEKKDVYLRYKENLDEHELDVVMRIGDGDVRLSRRGIIQMNFHFIPGVYTDTFYESPAGRHHFRLLTKQLKVEASRVEIEYELYENDENIGHYLYIIEKSESYGS